MLELLAVRPGAAPARPEGFFARLMKGPVAAARERGEADLGRLGLATAQHAEERIKSTSRIPEMVGPTVLRGERHGRAVEIRIDADRYRTRLDAAVPEFHVRSEDGRLAASERSPEEPRAALAGLSRDERWKGVEAKGGPDGITVFHRLGSRRRGSQGYLDDLWLAEGLADLLGGPAAAP
jgi:hypothetical protein